MTLDEIEANFLDEIEKRIPVNNDDQGILYIRNNLNDVSLLMRGSKIKMIAVLVGISYQNDDFKRTLMQAVSFLQKHPDKLSFEEIANKLKQ